MKNRLMIMIAALLGFSTACSSVKNAPAEGTKGEQTTDAPATDRSTTERATIRVMYGVSNPKTGKMATPLGTPAEQPETEESAKTE